MLHSLIVYVLRCGRFVSAWREGNHFGNRPIAYWANLMLHKNIDQPYVVLLVDHLMMPALIPYLIEQ